jgi:alcohol dehydrogenase (cytochrome c)
MRHKWRTIAQVVVALILIGFFTGGVLYYLFPVQVSLLAARARSYVLSLNAPPGTTKTESNPAYKSAAVAETQPPAASPPGTDWPSYNRTLTSERYSPLGKINTKNVGRLKVLCTYDTGQRVAFESGLIMADGALIGTTEFDTFSIDPATCALNWRTREDYPPAFLPVNRGAAYMDGVLFRGTQDGRVLAYDFKTGGRLWATTIADATLSESVPAAPIAWNGLVFVGNAGGDYKGGKGHMYALDAKTGKIVWEFFLVPRAAGDAVRGPPGSSPLDASSWKSPSGMPISGGGAWTSYTLDPQTGRLYVPVGNAAPDFEVGVREGEDNFTDSVLVLDAKTGAYKDDFKLLRIDWHDWDASNPPALIDTAGGKRLLAVAPKDGYLYGFDIADNKLIYRVPATTIENVDMPFSPDRDVHFCPGSTGGDEWNSPAFDPLTNLILVGEVDWCTTVRAQTDEELRDQSQGQPWMGERSFNPFDLAGKQSRADGYWSGWIYAIDADTGVWKWRLKANYPVVGGITPTAGGIVFVGDVGGNFYALDAVSGEKLWGRKIGGPIAGGVITYSANGAQKVAVATGFTNPVWPTEVATAKIVVLGLGNAGTDR